MASNTKKIGEYAIGGTIKSTVTGNKLTIQNLDYRTNKEVLSRTFTISETKEFDVDMYLTEVSTSYYASEIMKWIKPLCEFSRGW